MQKKLAVLLITMFLLNSSLFAQQSTVTGTITDENANPLVGATVAISGSNTAVATDANGNFSINASKGQTLEITYIGKLAEQDTAGCRAIGRQIRTDPNAGRKDVLGFGARNEQRLVVVEHGDGDRFGKLVAGTRQQRGGELCNLIA